MTPSDILARVRDQLVEATAAFWTDAEIYRYMTDAEREICTTVECYRLSTSTTTTTGTSGYTLPADCINVVAIEWDGVPLKQVDQRGRWSLDMPSHGGTPKTGTPTHYWRYGTDMVYLWPVPDDAKALRYYYTADPPAITTASTAYSIPPQYHPAIQDYVLYRAFTKDQDQGRAEWHKREYMQAMLEAQYREYRRRWAGGFPKVKTSEKNFSVDDGVV